MVDPHRAPLRVCVDARVREGVSGGVQQAIIGLASGLSQLQGPEEYLFLSEQEHPAWLTPHLRGPCRLLRTSPRGAALGKQVIKRFAPGRLLDAAYATVAPLLPVTVAASDGTVEAAGVEVMHFALQHGFRTAIPSIYLPHDLQHVHLPGLFGRADLRWRTAVYPALCAQARAVVALSQWGKRDLVESYGLPEAKVRVIPWGPVVDSYPAPTDPELAEASRRHALPAAFAFFPAQTFRHKNHLGLLEALALLRERDGLRIDLVCCGHRDEFFPVIERQVRKLRLPVRFLGFVSPLEIRCLYALATLLVFPSRFEGFGMPVLEAFRVGLPVATSVATSLRELAEGAALLFDPDDTHAMADAMKRLWTDANLREQLIARGHERASAYNWRKTGLIYRALYREIAGRPVTTEDRALLSAT